jgi:hypothetical protein
LEETNNVLDPLDVGHERATFPVAEVFDAKLGLLPHNSGREARVALTEQKHEPDLAALRCLVDRGDERVLEVVRGDLADGFEADYSVGQIAERLEHRAPPRACRSRRYRRAAWSSGGVFGNLLPTARGGAVW